MVFKNTSDNGDAGRSVVLGEGAEAVTSGKRAGAAVDRRTDRLQPACDVGALRRIRFQPRNARLKLRAKRGRMPESTAAGALRS